MTTKKPSFQKTTERFNHQESPSTKPKSETTILPEQPEIMPTELEQFPIIGIGVSAGEIEVFEPFFAPNSSNLGMAFVIVPHSESNQDNLFHALIQKYTTMPVLEGSNNMPIQPNHVYIIPPFTDITIQQGTLHIVPASDHDEIQWPIDFFFRALAQTQQEYSIAILLSGTGCDGSLGLKAIKEVGGLTIVQKPQTAEDEEMLHNAIATHLVDYVLAPDQMMGQLLTYIRQTFIATNAQISVPAPQNDLLQTIFTLLSNQMGHDFSSYKQNTIIRRIERRMLFYQIDKMADYVSYLQQNTHEVETLFKEFLIGVSNFFRNKPAFELLEQKVIPTLFKYKVVNQAVRIWLPGCSTGEEAYSLAILITAYLEKLQKAVKVQIFATDIDEKAIEKARTGIYSANIISDIPADYLHRFFIKEKHSYVIIKSIRDILVFAPQNVIKDPPFSKMDLISCRNLLIYMKPELQKQIIALFHYSLNPDGYLFLGSSETIGDFTNLFAVIDRKWKIFQRKNTVNSYHQPQIDFAVLTLPPQITEKPKNYEIQIEPKFQFHQLAEQAILANYVSACIITNEKGEILYIYGHTHYLKLVPGKANWTIINLALEELKVELSEAMHKVITLKQEVHCDDLKIKINNETRIVNFKIKYISEPLFPQPLLAILFENQNPPIPLLKTDLFSLQHPEECEHRITELEKELQSTKGYLQAFVDELEASTQELKLTNEESQSANEELQSVNEELETSKEELQSINEELIITNTKLVGNIEDLSKTNNNMRNLLESTKIGTLFLSKKLIIQSFTPPITQVINLIDTDQGRPLTDIATNLEHNHLVEYTQAVLRTLASNEVEVRTKKGVWYLMSLMPYRTLENVVQGVVITFVNINKRKQAELALQKNEKRLQTIISEAPVIVFIRKPEKNFRLTFMVETVFILTGYQAEEFMLSPNLWEDNIHPDDKERVLASQQVLFAQGVCHQEYRFRCKNGDFIWIRDDSFVNSQPTDERREIVGYWIDITSYKAEMAKVETESCISP